MSRNLNTKVWETLAPNSFLRTKYPTIEEYVNEQERRRNPNWAKNNVKKAKNVADAHARPASRRLVGGRRSTRKTRKARK